MQTIESQHGRLVNVRRCLCASVCSLLVLAPAGVLFATDALRQVPADVAGVIVFRQLSSTNKKLTAFVRRIDPDHPPFEFGVVKEKTLGLPPGTMDASKPVVVILTKPGELMSFLKRRGLGKQGGPYPVVAFSPKHPAKLLKKLHNRENRARRQEGPHGKYYLLMRDGVAFFSPRRKGLRILRGVRPEASLATTLDEGDQTILATSDVFVHLRLARLRDRINPFIWIFTNAMKMGIAAQQDPASVEPMQNVVNWMVNGLRSALDQMDSISLALQYDGKTFRLTHRHVFAPDGSVAAYLGQVRRGKQNLWKPLPDQPFVMAGVFDWQSPPESSVLCRLNRFFWNSDFARKSIPEGKRKKLLASAEACYGGMKGMQFMVTTPPGAFNPIQVFGGYAVDDAEDILDKYSYLQENAGKALAAFMPGGTSFGGEFKKCRRGGVKCFEMRFDVKGLPEQMRRQIINVYGEGARVQQAVADKHLLVYSIAQPPCGVSELVKAVRSGRNLGQNPAVRRILSRMPDDANAIVVLDVGRTLALLPHMAKGVEPESLRSKLKESKRRSREAVRRAHGGEADGKAPPVKPSRRTARPSGAVPSDKPGPLLGWSCCVRKDVLDCRLVMDADDVLRSIKLAHVFLYWARTERSEAQTPSP